MYLSNNTLLQGGKYKIVRFISKGGFGLTYEGIHTMMNTRVAIKEFFSQKFCSRDEATSHVTVGTQGSRIQIEKLIKKFKEEAVAVFNMKHDNIVRVLDIFEENGTAYYVMEYINGKSLDEISKERGPLPEAEAVGYIRQIADALKYVHSLDRLHLDIKPGNIMVDKNGKAILIDFGASKHYDNETGENDSTLMGIYSEHYAPIEQFNRTFRTFSPSADIYALGATLYKLVTGITPPAASLLASGETLEIPASLSASTRNAIIKSMQTSRIMRPQSIAEFLQLLSLVSHTDDSTIFEASGSSANPSHRNNVNDDESTRIETSAWQEEEAQRQREFQAKAEREAKAAEEARHHAEEVERKSREEAERRRKEEARKREEEKRKAQEEASKQSSGHAKAVVWIIATVVVLAAFIMNMSSGTSPNNTSQSNTTQTNKESYVTREAMYYEGGQLAYYWTGNLVNGYPEGYGTIDYPENDPDKRYQYKGYMKQSLRDGSNGELTYRNGNSYKGGFSNDNFVNGKLTLKNDGVFYNGTFKDNKPFNGSWYNLNNNKEISKFVNGVESNSSNASKTPKKTVSNKAENGKLIESTQKVDLGLPSGTIWAGWNIGANAPEQCGNYYAWGETSSKSTYSMSNYFDTKTYNVEDYGVINATFNYYNGQNGIYSIVGTDRDVVKRSWGNNWQMPSEEQIRELIEKCTFTYTKYHNAYGFVCTGPNGKSIFLPASGFYEDSNIKEPNFSTNLWSGSLSSSNPACSIVFTFQKIGMSRPNYVPALRYMGYNVRGVVIN